MTTMSGKPQLNRREVAKLAGSGFATGLGMLATFWAAFEILAWLRFRGPPHDRS
jgi:hypothetical protein